MELSGTWRAVVADEDLRRTLARRRRPDDDGWEPVEVPGPLAVARRRSPTPTGRCSTARAFEHDRAGGRRARRGSRFDGLFYQGDVWLDGAYLGDTEGYFFPHTFEVTEALADRDASTSSPSRSTCSPADRPHRQAQPHRRLPALGLPRPRLEPRRHLAAGRASSETGPVRIRDLRVLCREADRGAGRASVLRAVARQRRGRRAVAVAHHRSARVDHELGRSRWPPARTRSSGRSPSTEPALWWPRALGDQPLHDVAVEVAARRRRASRATDERRCAPGCARSQLRDWVAVGQRRAPVPQGREPRARPAWRSPRRRPSELRRDVDLAVDAGLDLLRVHAHITRPELYDAADEAGPAALAGPAPAVGLRPRHPQAGRAPGRARPSTCSATTRRSRSGAATTSRWRIDVEPAAEADPTAAPHGRAALAGPGAADVEQDGARPLGRSGPSRRPTAHGRSSPTRACCPTRRTLDGTDSHLYFGWYHGDERDLPGFLARAAPPGALRRPSSAPRRCPTTRRLPASPSAGPTSTGSGSAAPTRSRSGASTGTCRRPTHATFDVVAGRHPGVPGDRRSSTTSRRCAGSSTGRPAASPSSASPTATRRSRGRCSTTSACRRPATRRCGRPAGP